MKVQMDGEEGDQKLVEGKDNKIYKGQRCFKHTICSFLVYRKE